MEMIRRMKEEVRFLLFGDVEPRDYEPVLVFHTKDQIIVCDFSECGMHVAMKHVKSGLHPSRMKLIEILSQYPEYPIEAWNNIKARYIRKHNIKTAKDLLNRITQ